MPRRKQLSDEAVLDAVMPAIFAAGPDKCSLAEAAAAAGLSAATLVQRFGSKHAMVVAALELTNRRNFAALDSLTDDIGAEAVIRIFVHRTPGPEHEAMLSDQLLWLRESMADPAINAVSRDYFMHFRRAIEQRMPPLPIAPREAVLLVEAQWHGALTQWGIAREGHLRDHVERSLRIWFELAGYPTRG